MSAGFAKVLKALIGKEVEIYQGDSHETLLTADKDIDRKSVIRGKLLEVIDECLIVECNVGGTAVKVYVNSWTISAILEPRPGACIHSIYNHAERRVPR